MDKRQIMEDVLSRMSVKIFLCLFIPMFFVTIFSFAKNGSEISAGKKDINFSNEQVLVEKKEIIDTKEETKQEEPVEPDVVVNEELERFSTKDKKDEKMERKDVSSLGEESHKKIYEQNEIVNDIKSSTVIIVKDRKIDPGKPMVAITFDDGPNKVRTNKILDILEQHNVVATFFELGSLAKKNKDTIIREESLGCEVGNHSYEHKNLDKLTDFGIREDIRKSEMIFEEILGHKTRLFRAPYGNANNKVRNNVDYPIIKWDIDTLDWKFRDKEKILRKIREVENYDGRIILMHSLYDSTVDAVGVIVPELIEKGYQLVTVSELAYYKGYDILENGKVYCNFR